MIAPLLVAVVALLLLAAAFWDVATMTIPNWLSAAVALLFPIAAIAAGVPWHGIAFNVAFGAAMLLGCFFLFNAGILGGGDAKLIPAAAMWTGAAGFAPFALVMALAGGLVALVVVAMRRTMAPSEEKPEFLNRLLDKKRGLPYGVAIAAGFLLTFAQSPLASLIQAQMGAAETAQASLTLP
ncbi:MAG: prepilin peptidase [Hyphomonadaceae bacterium]